MPAHQDPTTRERVWTVYQEVWHEFFDWEREYCLQTLASLTPFTLNEPPTILEQNLPDDLHVQTEDAPKLESDCAEVWCFDADGAASSKVLACPTYSCTSLEPGQPYEACTYSHKNLYIADDACEKMPFMPFSDDPQFPAKELLEFYDSLGWKTRKDPDRKFFPNQQLCSFLIRYFVIVDIVAAEAVRRLHFGFGIPFADIDETGILPMAIVERPERKGLLHMLNQRYLFSKL